MHLSHPRLPRLIGSSVILPAIFVPALTAAGEPPPELEVVEQRPIQDQRLTADAASGAPGTASLLQALPGATVMANGAISGQVQYRGLSGARLDVRIDGAPVEPGGPNWMDPPLHYVSRSLLANLTLNPASALGNGLGARLDAKLWRMDYAAADDSRFSGRLDAGGRSGDDGRSLGFAAGVANEHLRAQIMGSRGDGDDRAIGDDERLEATAYERDTWGFAAGVRGGGHHLDADYLHTETGLTGTPTLPLDIAFFDTERVRFAYRGALGPVGIELIAHTIDVNHRMTNYALRPAPDFSQLPLPPFAGTDRRFVDATSVSRGLELALSTPAAGGSASLTLTANEAEHDAVVRDPDFAPFFATNFNEARTSRYNARLGWRGRVAEFDVTAGLGFQYETAETGAVDAFPAQLADANPSTWPAGTPPRAVFMLRERFNAADRTRDADTFSWHLEAKRALAPAVSVKLTAQRSARFPLYQERFLWIPLEVNAGLGDGNNYVGDPGLRPEVAHALSVSIEARGGAVQFAPSLFYRHVDDWIQGTPVADPVVTTVSASASANGDPTPLQFTNTEARIWGADIGLRVRLSSRLRLDASAWYHDGRNLEVNDGLFRLSPPGARLALRYHTRRWSVEAETALWAEQQNQAKTLVVDPSNPSNSDRPSHGFATLDVNATIQLPNDYGDLIVGVDNVFDRRYVAPTGGFNRVRDVDVAVGARAPGRGRSLFARAILRW